MVTNGYGFFVTNAISFIRIIAVLLLQIYNNNVVYMNKAGYSPALSEK